MLKLHPELLAALRADERVAVLTPGRRLVRQLREVYSEQFGMQEEPSIYLQTDWVTETTRPVLDEKGLTFVSEDLAFLLWQEAFANLPDAVRGKLNPQFLVDEDALMRLIRRAQQAWRQLYLYKVAFTEANFASSESAMSELFYQWACAYLELCRQKHLVDLPLAYAEFKQALERGKVRPSASLWVGFTLLDPVQQELVDLIKQAGGKCTLLDRAFVMAEQTAFDLRQYPNEKTEVYAIAEKVAELHIKDPQKRIGVVIPKLEQEWRAMRRIFNEVMRQKMGQHAADPLFDMSWGDQHHSYPLVGDLLRLLQLTQDPMPVPDWIQIFMSPYLRGSEAERGARSNIDAKLSRLSEGYRELRLTQLLGSEDSQKEHTGHLHPTNVLAGCPRLRAALRAYLQVPNGFVAEAAPAQWATTFVRQAEALGWGSQLKWTSAEVQVWSKWLDALDRLYAAGSVLSDCSRQQALAFLRRQTEQVFQPAPQRDKKVHLLAVAPARGLGYDELFLCRMHEHALERPQPNFFISYKLARAADMPWCSPERRRRMDADVLRQLSCAEHIHISYAATSGDEENSMHPLVEEWGLKLQEEERIPRQFKVFDLEKVTDDDAPRVLHEKELIDPGGVVTIVREQAACPFRAFARCRLGIRPSTTPITELSPLARGNLIHQLLKQLWTELESPATLKDLSDDALTLKIDKAADILLRKAMRRQAFLRDEMLCAAEKRFLTEMTTGLLLWEKNKREDHFRIASLEESVFITSEQLPPLEDLVASSEDGPKFKLIVDRIDAFEDGTLIIDYKTSKNISARDLDGDRPREPQLIVYSLAVEDVKGLGFISFSLKKGVEVEGFAMLNNQLFPVGGDNKRTDPSGRVNFPQRNCQIDAANLQAKQEAVKNLLADHLKGKAAVDPRGPEDCRYCDYKGLCRIAMGSAQAE